MKLDLSSVTLVCIDCINADRATRIIEHCKTKADFGEVKLLSSIENNSKHWVKIKPLTSLVMYSVFVLKDLHLYINTSHVLIVQRDGWILNPESFDLNWLQLDYIGGLFMQYDRCGSGGFSLRSKRIMQDVSKTIPDWDGTQDDADKIQSKLCYYEDGILSMSPFSKKYKIATLDQAANFSQAGNRNPKYLREKPFGWHRTWQVIDFKTGKVDSSDTSKDIHVSYDYEIDTL